jgi:hypothetical protein
LQENRSDAAKFRQKELLEKAQSAISFNALQILHGRLPRTEVGCARSEGAEIQRRGGSSRSIINKQ